MSQAPNPWPNRAIWTLQILLAAVFLFSAGTKFVGIPMMVGVFEQIGIGQWFRYFTAVLEVAASIMLLVPRLIPVGAALLAATMLVDVPLHVFVMHSPPAPAAILAVLSLLVLWLRRDSLRRDPRA